MPTYTDHNGNLAYDFSVLDTIIKPPTQQKGDLQEMLVYCCRWERVGGDAGARFAERAGQLRRQLYGEREEQLNY